MTPAAIVTGGSSGIGAATAEVLLRSGYDVLICARDEARLDVTARRLQGLDVPPLLGDPTACTASRLLTRTCDVADEAAVERTVGDAVTAFGGLDAVVNCAATVGAQRELTELPEAEWDRVLDVGLKGAWRTIRAAAPHLGRGSAIVNVASVNAFRAEPSMGAYGIAKAGLLALTRYMACELAPRGVRVNAVAPGWVRTPMSEPALADLDLIDGAVELNMQRRIAAPMEIAETIAFLLSARASYVTGETLTVDGGETVLMANAGPSA